MLAFDVHKRNRIWLECWITVDVWDDTDLSVGAFLDETAHCSSIGRLPIHGKSGGIKALQLGHVVFSADNALDRSGMRISKGMAMIGSKEMMGDSLLVETIDTEEVPHPLTVTSLKMMWSSITPHINAVEVIVELLVVEEG